jgi:hypothetical protein
MADTGGYTTHPYWGTTYPVGTEAYLDTVPVRVLVATDRGAYIVVDQAGVHHAVHHHRLAVARSLVPSCPDCQGVGVGCCVNADIPLPGTER